MTQINISLPDELIVKTKTYTKNKGQTFSGLIRICLEKQLMEDQ